MEHIDTLIKSFWDNLIGYQVILGRFNLLIQAFCGSHIEFLNVVHNILKQMS